MYTPSQPGIPRILQDGVSYQEHRPFSACDSQIFCFWELRTSYELPEDCHYLVLPDACIDLVFDTSGRTADGMMVMTPGLQALDLNLGRRFSYSGIRLLPGVWRDTRRIVAQSQSFSTLATVCLVHLCSQLAACSHFSEQQALLQTFINRLTDQGTINKTAWMPEFLAQSDQLASVEDLVRMSGYSRRHLQRLCLERTGFSAHDFLKILRFHASITRQSIDAYTDQSHYIREFKRITGKAPVAFRQQYR